MFFAIETPAADREPTRDYEHFKSKIACCKFCSYCSRAFAKERSPGAAVCFPDLSSLKSVKGVSCVIPLSHVNIVTNAPNVVTNLRVGARLQMFWEKWSELGASPKVVQILREGYTLPFRTRPNLSRTPTVVSCYGNPHRNLKLLEALHQLTAKNAIERVHKQTDYSWFPNPTTNGGQS